MTQSLQERYEKVSKGTTVVTYIYFDQYILSEMQEISNTSEGITLRKWYKNVDVWPKSR